MYPDVILGGRNLSGTSLYNFKVEERHCFLHDWLKAETILLPAFNSKMFFFSSNILDRWELFWKKQKQKDVPQHFCAHFKNAQYAPWDAKFDSVFFVIWCFIVYRILWTHQSTVCFVLCSNVLTHIPETVIWKLKNVEIGRFNVLEHSNASKAGQAQISGWVCCIDFCSLRMVFSSMVESGTFGLDQLESVVISLL